MFYARLFICIFLCVSTAEARLQIRLVESLKVELNEVLKATSKMHTAFIKLDEVQIAASVQGAIDSIQRAEKRLYLAKDQQPHLTKMLQAANSYLQATQMQNGEKRKKSLKKAFEQIVNLAKAYKLDNYRIFFCAKDKSVWIQKSWKPKNPIHPKTLKNCGRLVGRT